MRLGDRVLPRLWTILVAATVVVLFVQIRHKPTIETNILKLLPAPERDPIIDSAFEAFTRSMSRRIAVIVGHPDEQIAEHAAHLLASSLESTGYFEKMEEEITDAEGRGWFDLYFPLRYQLLTPELRRLLRTPTPVHTMVERTARSLYGPMPTLYGRGLADDPLMLFAAYLRETAPTHPGFHVGGRLPLVTHGDTTYAVLAPTLRGDPMTRSVQAAVTSAVESRIDSIRALYPDVEFRYTGFVRFAHAAFSRARGETSTIGLISFGAVIILLLAMFGSLREPLIGTLSIVVGLCAALAVSLAVFPNVHVVTLSMGAALIGICIDYSLHFFADRMVHPRGWSGTEGLRRVFPGIALGALTSVIGYAGFFLSPFPGLAQIALFSSTGLIAAFGTVVCWYPSLTPPPPNLKTESSAVRIAGLLPAAWNRVSLPTVVVGFLILGSGVALIAMFAGFDDDIRALGYTERAIEEDDAAVRNTLSDFDGSRFILVRGGTAEELLLRLETLSDSLEGMKGIGALGGFRSPATALPSTARQRADRSLLAGALAVHGDTLNKMLLDLGFTTTAVDALLDSLRHPPTRFLQPSPWLASPVSRPWRHQWIGQVDGQTVALVLLRDLRDPPRIRRLCAQSPGVAYIDTVGDLSDLLGRYRRQAVRLVILAYGFIFLLLVVRYGVAGALLVTTPPVLASLSTISILTLLGIPLTLMHVISLLLVLGIGIDYTIFFAESTADPKGAMLGIALSACTTFLSFGLLFVSRTPAVRSIGIVVAPTIVLCLLLAPVAQRAARIPRWGQRRGDGTPACGR